MPTRIGGQPRVTRDALIWLAAYVLVVVAPLLLLLVNARPEMGRGLAWDFAMALGYSALAMFGVQFALTARFRRISAPFGIDIIYYFHRYLAVYALLIAVAHAGVVVFTHPEAIASLDPRIASASMNAGVTALALCAFVIVLALGRRRLRLEYDHWRLAHAVLAAVALALALWHLFGAAHYLDSVWKRGLWAVYGAGWIGLLVYVRLLRPSRLMRAPWRVVEVRPERGRVWTLVIEPAAGQALRFAPGQFAWLSLRTSPFAMREHPFSIASSAQAPGRIEFSIKEFGDFSASIRHVQPGETAWVDAPYGAFTIDRHPEAPGYVFVAGGIGAAPVLSMLRTLSDRGDRRPLLLIYGNRVWERVAFREELDRLERRLALRIVHVLREPGASWAGERGLVDEALLARHLPGNAVERAALEYFVCGPTPMTLAAESGLAALGVPAGNVHSEIFDWV
jgi:predicted ferric reductase